MTLPHYLALAKNINFKEYCLYQITNTLFQNDGHSYSLKC